jgi:hypothetical protein
MTPKWKGILAAAVLGTLAVVAVVTVGIALGGGDGSTSKEKYQTEVINARDRVDFALTQITRARSPDELLSRIDEAANTIDGVAGSLGGVSAPKGLTDENDRLVRTLHALSDDLAGTADTLRDPTFSGALPGINSLSFPEWDEVNAILSDLEAHGIHVQPLARH